MSTPTNLTYDPIAKAFHWGIALAILIVLVTASMLESPTWLIDERTKNIIFALHKTFGFLDPPLSVWRACSGARSRCRLHFQ